MTDPSPRSDRSSYRQAADISGVLPPRFEHRQPAGKLVMAFPNLIIREVICFQLLLIGLIVVSLLFDAPLEEMANPQVTPNPAKAPWYFLGLQELLHYFPPVVAGVLIPLAVLAALVVLPYHRLNVERRPMWEGDVRRRFRILTLVAVLIIVVCSVYHAHAISIPTVILYCCASLPFVYRRDMPFLAWIRQRPVGDWIMTWFVIVSTVLILIGTYFRGPGWSWIWPWE